MCAPNWCSSIKKRPIILLFETKSYHWIFWKPVQDQVLPLFLALVEWSAVSTSKYIEVEWVGNIVKPYPGHRESSGLQFLKHGSLKLAHISIRIKKNFSSYSLITTQNIHNTHTDKHTQKVDIMLSYSYAVLFTK